MSEPSKLIRNALFNRSMGCCEVAGEPLPWDNTFAVHHRKRRSQGGEHDLTNLMIVCHYHHNGATNSIHAQPALSYQRGWLVIGAEDPAMVPMQRFIRLDDPHGKNPTFYLTEDGRYRKSTHEGDLHGGS